MMKTLLGLIGGEGEKTNVAHQIGFGRLPLGMTEAAPPSTYTAPAGVRRRDPTRSVAGEGIPARIQECARQRAKRAHNRFLGRQLAWVH